MDIFNKWRWIKKNWQHIIEEGEKLGLVFVGGTALNLCLLEEYRASEDIDFYNPKSKGIDNPNGKTEKELARLLAQNLVRKGFKVREEQNGRIYIGPEIKIDIFHDGTLFKKINKKKIGDTAVLLFDLQTYANMKMAALLCRTTYDARDLIDIYLLHKKLGTKLLFPTHECEMIEIGFKERVAEIAKTKKDDLLLFQDNEQINALQLDKFDKFKRWLVEWLSGFY